MKPHRELTRLEAQLQRVIDDSCLARATSSDDVFRRIAVESYEIGRATVERENAFFDMMGIPLETPAPFPESEAVE